jgi:hypothetical protein
MARIWLGRPCDLEGHHGTRDPLSIRQDPPHIRGEWWDRGREPQEGWKASTKVARQSQKLRGFPPHTTPTKARYTFSTNGPIPDPGRRARERMQQQTCSCVHSALCPFSGCIFRLDAGRSSHHARQSVTASWIGVIGARE